MKQVFKLDVILLSILQALCIMWFLFTSDNSYIAATALILTGYSLLYAVTDSLGINCTGKLNRLTVFLSYVFGLATTWMSVFLFQDTPDEGLLPLMGVLTVLAFASTCFLYACLMPNKVFGEKSDG